MSAEFIPLPITQNPPRALTDVPPNERTDDEILMQNGYTNLPFLMRCMGLNHFNAADIQLARGMILSMRIQAQRSWEEKMWNQTVAASFEAKAALAKSKEENERLRRRWTQSQREWELWDRDQQEREARLGNANKPESEWV